MSESDIQQEINAFLDGWEDTPSRTKKAFLQLKEYLSGMQDIKLAFNARPGVTYSLRAAHPAQKDRDLFVMVDVIDDDPEDRWLSVCFYGDMITDPEEKGDFVPEGLLGEDAHCIDLEEYNDDDLSYLEARLDEAYKSASSLG